MIAKPKQKPQQGYQPSEADEMDKKIAVGLSAVQMLSPEGSQVIAKNLASKNPAKQIAIFLGQLIEQVMEASQGTEIPMSPAVWMSEGGVIDELGEILATIAEKSGIQVDIAALIPAIKQELMVLSEAANKQMQQQEQAGPPQGAPPQGPPAGAQPSIGGPVQ